MLPVIPQSKRLQGSRQQRASGMTSSESLRCIAGCPCQFTASFLKGGSSRCASQGDLACAASWMRQRLCIPWQEFTHLQILPAILILGV